MAHGRAALIASTPTASPTVYATQKYSVSVEKPLSLSVAVIVTIFVPPCLNTFVNTPWNTSPPVNS